MLHACKAQKRPPKYTIKVTMLRGRKDDQKQGSVFKRRNKSPAFSQRNSTVSPARSQSWRIISTALRYTDSICLLRSFLNTGKTWSKGLEPLTLTSYVCVVVRK